MEAPDEIPTAVIHEVAAARLAEGAAKARLIDEHPEDWLRELERRGVDVSDPIEVMRQTLRAVHPDAFRD